VPEASSREIPVPRLSATERLVALAPLPLLDARDGSAPGLTTALRLGRRGDRLLLRFDCRHRGVVATMREDNADLWREDVVEAFLSFDDPPFRYLELEVNPLGARFSAVVESPNLSREGMTVEKFPFLDFQAEVKVRERRWSAVLSIPLGLEGAIFRGNFYRIDRTSREFSALFPTLADPPDFHVPRSFGRFRLEP
jgi:hypothetical protein